MSILNDIDRMDQLIGQTNNETSKQFSLSNDDIDSIFTSLDNEKQTIKPAQSSNAPDFIPGIKRGVQNLQASSYGAVGLAGDGLKKLGFEESGQKLQNYGFEGYHRNIEEAKQTPAKYSFKDVYTGKAGLDGTIDWAQGVLGELVPSMVEAVAGATVGSLAAPGPGTAVGGFAGRTILKKSIDQAMKSWVKEGTEKAVEDQIRKQVTKQALKKFGGKIGMGAAVFPMESGSMYGDLFESHGVDAPETAMLFGALSTALEYAGGNSKLVDTFVDAMAKGSKGTAKQTAKEILKNIPQEALQEGGQEVFNILNTVVNTDEKLLTLDNVERIVESMAAGVVGGGAGAGAQFGMEGRNFNKPSKLDTQVDNIKSGGIENIQAALTDLDAKDNFANSLLNNSEELQAQATQFGMTVEELSNNIGSQIMANNQLREKLKIELAKPIEEVQQTTEPVDINVKLEELRKQQESKQQQEIAKQQQIKSLNAQADKLRKEFYKSTDETVKADLKNQIVTLLTQRNALINEGKQETAKPGVYEEPKKADEILAERQKVWQDNWVDESTVERRPEIADKDAKESASVIYPYIDQLDNQLNQLYQQIDTETNNEKRNQLQREYEELFGKRNSIINTFEENDQAKFDAIVNQVETDRSQLTNEQQTVVNANTAQIKQLTAKLNSTIDRAERISLLNQIDGLSKINEGIRTPLENVSQLGEANIATDVTSAQVNDQVDTFDEVDYEHMSDTDLAKSINDFNINRVIAQAHQSIAESRQQNSTVRSPDEQTVSEVEIGPNTVDVSTYTNFNENEGTPEYIITKSKNPYKNKTLLERKIKSLPNYKNYLVVKVADGYIGVRKDISDKAANQFQSIKRTNQRNIKPYSNVTSIVDATPVDITPENLNDHQFQTTENNQLTKQVNIEDVKAAFPNQQINQDEDGSISIQFKNGKGLTIRQMQQAENGFVKYAIETGQMSKNGKILGMTVGNEILLDENFADNSTLWHENKHVLDNLGMITEADNSMLNAEFNRLRKLGKLNFALSTHEDSVQRMVENRANMFAQIMVDRAAYRDKPLGKVIQRIMDFFQQLFAFGKQTVAGLSREVESGKIYERQIGNQTYQTYQTTIPQAEVIANKWYSSLENAVNRFQQKQATPDQWKGMINNFPGIKAEELDWIGLNDWLDEQQGKVSKVDLLNFIQSNKVQLEEVVQGKVSEDSLYDALGKIEKALEPYEYYAKIYNGKLVFTSPEGFDVDENNIDNAFINQEIKNIFHQSKNMLPEVLNDPQYSGMTLPGGENYKEIILTLPKQISKEDQKRFNDLDKKSFDKMTENERIEYDQLLRKVEGNEGTYQHSHWSGINNPLSHIRFDERTDVDGNKVLFINELQSDWHQEGNKSGYGTREEIKNNLIQQLRNGEISREEYNQRRGNLMGFKGVPDAPFKKSWPMLAMKRMIRYAAENGFDKIAWPSTPEQIAKVEGWGEIEKRGDSYFINGDQNISSIVNRYLQDIPRALNKEFNRGKWGSARVEFNNSKDKEWIKVNKEEALKNYRKTAYVLLDNIAATSALDIIDYQGDNIEIKKNISFLSLPITERMRSKALREGMPLFETREMPEQKLTDEEYAKMFQQKKSVWKLYQQASKINWQSTKLLADKLFTPISTRLKEANLKFVSDELRKLDFRTSKNIIDVLQTAKPILDIANGKKNAPVKMTEQDLNLWNLARLQADTAVVQRLAEKYGMKEQVEKLRTKLDQIRTDAIDVGLDVGFIDEYWPRVLKDQAGFLQKFYDDKEFSQRPIFTEALNQKAKEMGITRDELESYPDVKADVISNVILGRPTGLGGPGNIRSRKFDTIPADYIEFYMDADASLMQYVYSMTKKIEARRFFGAVPENIRKAKTEKTNKLKQLTKLEDFLKQGQFDDETSPETIETKITQLKEDISLLNDKLDKYKYSERDYSESIGAYIARLMVEGKLHRKDEQTVKDILSARFNDRGTHGVINTFKNAAYIDVMGNPMSALTQIGDLAWAMYVGKVWTPKGFSNTINNLINATFNKSKVTKEDIGIERIAQEFADGTTLGNAVSNVFKIVGLTKIDSIGKETLINNALNNYQARARSDNQNVVKQLRQELRSIFGNETEALINELSVDKTGNEKYSDNVKYLLYSRLLDFQPAALSEMPEMYLHGGNARVFYMLKTYTLKQFDVFRNEVFHKITKGNATEKLEGITNMIKLGALLTLANAGADELKDLLLGKETKFQDHIIENLLTMGGASRFVQMQVTKEGLGSAAMQQILPPMKFVNSLSKDLMQGYTNYVAGDAMSVADARIVESLPVVGKLAYWHVGRGTEYKKSIPEQDFKKAGSEARLFKKRLENSEDKRLFLQSNLNEFKRVKIHDNIQSSISNIQKTINKLEKMEQTPNIRKRLGQLEERKEKFFQSYFDHIDQLGLN